MRKKATPFHAVRLYDSEAALCRIVAGFLRESLAVGQPAVMIATLRHSLGIIAELRARELDVNALRAAGTLAVLDVEDTIGRFMADGVPNADRFRDTTAAAIDKARGSTRASVRVYSETVDLLWKQGRDTVALQVEMLWNKLVRSSEITLLCGCAMSSVIENASIEHICRQHTHLVASDGTARISTADSLLVGSLRL